MTKNGMKTFCFHVEDETPVSKRSLIDELAVALKRANLGELKFQEVAEKLMVLLSVECARDFVVANLRSDLSQLESIGMETWQFAKTHTIKFQQKYRNIPVYGSLVTVEVGENNDLLAINSVIGVPIGVEASPKFEPHEVKELIKQRTQGDFTNTELIPTIYFYFDSQENIWRLVYYIENKLKNINVTINLELIPEMVDYVIDAHTGDLVSTQPRVRTTKSII